MFTRSVAVLGTGTGRPQHRDLSCPDPRTSNSDEATLAPHAKMDAYFKNFVSVGDEIELNICGTPFKVRLRLLLKFPQSRLGKLVIVVLKNKGAFSNSNHKIVDVEETVNELCDVYHVQDDAYYFNRSPYNFEHILGIYRDGQAHFPIGQCASLFHEEMQYWKLSETIIGPCCMPKYLVVKKYMEPTEEPQQKEHQDISLADVKNVSTKSTASNNWASSKTKTWQFLETPSSSLSATIFSIISLIFVLATLILLIMSSMPEFQQIITKDNNQTETVIDPRIELADVFCLIFFTAEHAARFWSAPDRCNYLKTSYCIIDLLAIVPFYFELCMSIIGVERHLSGLTKSFMTIRILHALRVARVLRVLKVARYSRGFQSVASTFRKCWKESIMLIMFMLTTNVMFATFAYQLEIDNGTKGFESIPAASWWCIITMTTVGYGDVYPMTAGGRLLAAAVCTSGIILLAFPISVIVEHFQQEYKTYPEITDEDIIDS